MKRHRKHIPLTQLLASALADKLPQEERDRLRAIKADAHAVISLFTPDHIKLHCWGGPDVWWNIDMRRRGPELKAKDAADTSRAFKALRLDKWRPFMRKLEQGLKPSRPKRKPWGFHTRGRQSRWRT